MVYSHLINDIAIAMAYLIMINDQPFTTGHLLEGYIKKMTLSVDEIKALYYLIPLRYGISVCNSSEAASNGQETDYIMKSPKPAWEQLRKWDSYDKDALIKHWIKMAALD